MASPEDKKKSDIKVILPEKAQESFKAFYKSCLTAQEMVIDTQRSKMELIDRAYQRETHYNEDETRKPKAAQQAGDTSKFNNVTIPIIMPQVEAAVTYQTSVFLTGHPIFGVVAAPADMDAAIQLETKIEDDSEKGGWARQFMLFFRDGFKYNFCALEVSWEKEVVPAIETDLQANLNVGTVKDVIWAGNRVKRLNPYNVIYDRTCPMTEIPSKGDYAGYVERISKTQLKTLISDLPDIGKIVGNIKPAFESSCGSYSGAANASYYVPRINPEVDADTYQKSTVDWTTWAGLIDESKRKIDYKNLYEKTVLYCRVLPSEFNLIAPKENTPQIYKLIIINHEHIIYIEKQTNAHRMLPILIGQPNEDGLDVQTKSLAKNADDFQRLATAYMTSILASRRRAVSDRVLYNPSLIDAAQINSANPSAKIPVRPNAYNSDLSKAVYPFPYREDQGANSMQQMSAIIGLANTLNGQNQAQQGQFVKGNKTLHEYENVMQNANGRDQLASILLEHQVFTPLKTIIKSNILQYEGGSTLYNKERETLIEVDPIKLRTAVMTFKVSDGLIPSDKLSDSDALQVALQVIGSSPQIAAGYNITPLFSYMMKLQGAKLTEFEKSQAQVAYEQAVSTWQQTVLEVVKSGGDPKMLGEMPKPQDYNYNPEANDPTNQQAKEEQNGTNPQ